MLYNRKYTKKVKEEKKVEIPSSLHFGFKYDSVEVEKKVEIPVVHTQDSKQLSKNELKKIPYKQGKR